MPTSDLVDRGDYDEDMVLLLGSLFQTRGGGMIRKLCLLLTAVTTVGLLPARNAALFAQQPESARITGRVADAGGAGLSNATVSIPDLGLGATTATDGAYSIAIPSGRIQNQTVAVTARAIGYKPESVQLTLREGTMAQDFALTANPLQLGEIVVTGAGTVTQTEKLGNVRNNVSGDEVQRSNEPNIVQALAAKAPNVTVSSSSGEPGSGSYITIRGQRTIGLPGSGATQPLFVVDGVPIDNSSYSTLDVFNPVDGSPRARLKAPAPRTAPRTSTRTTSSP